MMIAPTAFGDFRSKLGKYLTGFMPHRKHALNQPLLSNEEIINLQLRVKSRNIQPVRFYDTAEQRAGDKQSIHRGYGLDYEESRIYQTGDEKRYMNWKLAARTGEMYMKVFREERRPGVYILLDRRSTMLYGTRTRLKVTQAARAAACIAFTAQQQHASIGAAVLEVGQKDPALIKEMNEKQAAAEIIRTACAPCPPIHDHDESMSRSVKNGDTFGRALDILLETISHGSSLYLIGDFIDLGEQHRSSLMQLSATNRVSAIHIYDPSEKSLPEMGTLHFDSAVNNQEIVIDTSNSKTSQAYKNAAMDHFTKRKNIFDALNISYKEISTICEPIETELMALK